MGTYLTLKLVDRSDKGAKAVNALWNKAFRSYKDTLHFKTEDDVLLDIQEIHRHPAQAHLRYIQTVEDWNNTFPIWSVGTFQVKITLGDYLCGEMAKRYLSFLKHHPDLFEELPSDYEMEILQDAAKSRRKATNCLVECPSCKPTLSRREILRRFDAHFIQASYALEWNTIQEVRSFICDTMEKTHV